MSPLIKLRSFLVSRPLNRVLTSVAASRSEEEIDRMDAWSIAVSESLKSFRLKTDRDLLRTWLILRLSAVDFFVDNGEKILKSTKKMVGKHLFDAVLRSTFYGQFAGGESMDALKETVNKLKEAGVRSMLCIPIETTATDENDLTLGEEMWKTNAALMNGCINMTDELEKGGFSQIKLTALCSPDLLLSMNEQLISHEHNHQEPFEWNIRRIGDLLAAERYQNIHIPSFTEQKNEQLRAALQRFDLLAKACKDKDLKIMMDAEQTYIQAALAYFILVLQQKYNSDIPVVYNTYQCYRKDTLTRLKADYDYATANGFKIAGKLVRGAYMVEEQRIAAETGADDPINDGYDKTTEMYHSVVDHVMPLIKARQAGFMIASHNDGTILHVLKRMKEIGLEKENNLLCFAQLYGMCDHVTEGLANLGCEVYKSVPYGTVDSTLLYLTRRAQENKSVMERSVLERGMIIEELFKRARSKFVPIGNKQ